MKHTRHSKHFGFTYPLSTWERLYSLVIGPLLFLFVVIAVLKIFSYYPIGNFSAISLSDLMIAASYTVTRLAIAYFLALIIGVPLAILCTSSPLAESLLLPVFDILESIPILAFFPVFIILFIKFQFLNGAAVFILFMSMLWNIVFTVVGGLKLIPLDITYAAKVFHIEGFDYFRKVTLPSVFPHIVTGSILAVAQGWNLIIVAEVMHVYIPNGTGADDLYGIGSILVQAAQKAQNSLFIAAILIMVAIIAFLNFFVWQKLLQYGERFKFE